MPTTAGSFGPVAAALPAPGRVALLVQRHPLRSVYELAPVLPCTDEPGRPEDWLKKAIPHDRRKIYDPCRILAAVFDQDSQFEIGRWQGGSVLALPGRLNGMPVGVIASDPKAAGGAMTLADCRSHWVSILIWRCFGMAGVLVIIVPREMRQVLCDWVDGAWRVVQGDLGQRAR